MKGEKHMESLISLFTNLVGEGQKVLPYVVTGAILIGGFLQATGGAEGLQKAKKWYIGGAVGLVVGMGASTIVNVLQSHISF